MKWKFFRTAVLMALSSGAVLMGSRVSVSADSIDARISKVARSNSSSGLNLRFRDVPAHGLVVAPLNVRRAVAAAQRSRVNWQKFQPIVTLPSGANIPAQWVPSADFDGRTNFNGTLVLQLPPGSHSRARLRASFTASNPRTVRDNEQMVETKNFTLFFDPLQTGGFPANITFAKSGQIFEHFSWNDRLHDPKTGGFALTNDRQAVLQMVSQGPVCTVMRNRARYVASDGTAPDSRPYAIYDWFVFNKLPLVYVTARARQASARPWAEFHFLELAFKDQSFKSFAGGEPRRGGLFKADKSSTTLSEWGALINDEDAIGMFGGKSLIYDGRGEYGTYLHFSEPEPWRGWQNSERRMAAWLWIGTATAPAEAVRTAAHRFTQRARLTALRPEVESRLEAMRVAANKLPSRERGQALWRASMIERRETEDDGDHSATPNLTLPPSVSIFEAGDFGLALDKRLDGISLHSLFDLRAAQELSSFPAAPLFTLKLRNTRTGEERQLVSDDGWKSVGVVKKGAGVDLNWKAAQGPGLQSLTVTARAVPDAKTAAWSWSLRVDNPSTEWTLTSVICPEARIADLGANAQVFFPRGPGEVKAGVWQNSFVYEPAPYPNGWCTMQFMAAYLSGTAPTGLYLGNHDPSASVKNIQLHSNAFEHSVQLSYEQLPEGIGQPGNDFTLPGHAVWQLLRGDWFDAASIYKAWAKKEAHWWPKLTANGREDTPEWMRNLSAWSLLFGDKNTVVPQATQLAKFLGVPTGTHWYNWHAIPFDNDYPHYFPTTAGFAEGVREAQSANVSIMPYINGRLWDTRDKGAEDDEYTRLALPWTTKEMKDGKLEPHTEIYGSKETDGSSVKLAAMCPATAFWQQKIQEIVLRLTKDEGVNGVYIDQIGAAAPVLCMDPTHGHPVGGGHWWVDGYGKMLAQIRAAMPKEAMLTTECNAEPYLKYLDGYLTWHWQNDGQVPAFPAVYGGAVQMFGRAYGGGETRNLALRMRAGQQLTYGEQIGWLRTEFLMKEIDEPSRDFFKRIVATRHHFRRYFYAGEMVRPPKLGGPLETVNADWQWSGVWPVTTDAVMTGAWRIPAERKLVLFFTNVSDEAPSNLSCQFDGSVYGIPTTAKLKIARLTDTQLVEGSSPTHINFAYRSTQPIKMQPRETQAWEISW